MLTIQLQIRLCVKIAFHSGYGSQKKRPLLCQRALKTGHFESGIALGAAMAVTMRDEPTHCQPATFNRHAGGQRLVVLEDRP
jgi:hypothetical protein